VLVGTYRDDQILFVNGPGRNTFSVLRLYHKSFMLTVARGVIGYSRPHKVVIDHLRRLLVLDQLAHG
jgi:hypothetical protein